MFGCVGYSEVAAALANLPCAPNLTALDIGSMESSQCVNALADAELPKLTWLSVRHNYASDSDLESLTKFSTVKTLRAEKNNVGHKGVKTATKDKVETEVGVGGTRTLVHARA